MKITRVELKKSEVIKNNVIATANVVFEGCFKVCGIKLTDRDGKRGIMFPAWFGEKQGKWFDIAYPLTAELRADILSAIEKEFDR